jgi:hypothetical protein
MGEGPQILDVKRVEQRGEQTVQLTRILGALWSQRPLTKQAA